MSIELINVTNDELDLLAEGELSSTERDDLFRRLDEHPHQWRFCGLAILETRAIECALKREAIGTSIRPVDRSTSTLAKSGSRWARLLVSACLLFVALGGGIVLGRYVPADDNSPALTALRSKVRQIERRQDDVQRHARSLANRINIGDETVLALVELEINGRTSVVPLIQSQQMSESILKTPAPSLSPRQIRAANQNGWNITQQKRLLAIDVPKKGTTKIVPLDVVRLKPVGRDLL